jgi:hypothetical protein
MAAKVKYPVRAALARVLPIRNHLFNMEGYLLQAGINEFKNELWGILTYLIALEEKLKLHQEKQTVGAASSRPGRVKLAPTEKQGRPR